MLSPCVESSESQNDDSLRINTHNLGNLLDDPHPMVTLDDDTPVTAKDSIKLSRNPPKLDNNIWNEYNNEFSDINKMSWKSLKEGSIKPEDFVTDLSSSLADFLKSKPEFQKETRDYFKHKLPSKNPLVEARNNKIKLNKTARKPNATEAEKQEALEAVRLHNYLLKLEKDKEIMRLTKEQEKSYRNNFWKTAKNITNGTYNTDNSTPKFSKNTADTYYKNRYEKPVNIDSNELNWFPKIDKPSVPYNLDPYTPKDIRKALTNKDLNTAPGEDGIVYEYLLRIPYLHQVLATAFTMIRDNGTAPDSWGSSTIVLIMKDTEGSVDDPTNFRMICLTLNIAKLYHTLEANRLMTYMVENDYIDKTTQKAYIQGINGCIEHVTLIHEIIQHAKYNGDTTHITWFDLEDAFGSISHDLIPYVMSYYHVPLQIIHYITNLYTKLTGKVVTPNWKSNTFQFLKGVFQGDVFSGPIFLLVFNPIIEYVKKHAETHGYKLTTKNNGVMNVTTTPFSDDFNLITKNETQHQNLVLDVEKKLKTMGLVRKVLKCRSLSIVKGKIKNVKFYFKNDEDNTIEYISTISEKPMKFLGSEVTKTNTPHATFDLIHSKLKEKLENINKSTLRGEWKLNIYVRFALPSMRYYFSVHNILKTHMNKLDDLARKYLKKWLKIPSKGVTDASIYHPYMLGVKTPSHLYREAHATNYASMRLKGDKFVNLALDSRLERESEWKGKYSTIVEMESLCQQNTQNSSIPVSTEGVSSKLISQAKKAMKKSLQVETLNLWNDKIKQLVMQGDFLQLLSAENENVTWKSIIHNTPKGVLSFALRSSTNSLATPDNLKRWGQRNIDKCPLCGNFCNLEHILNWCITSLNQGRFTWRHNSVAEYLTLELKKAKPTNITIYCDTPGHSLNGGTIPPDIIVTQQRPDVTIVNRSSKTIALLELTCSFEKNINQAHFRKVTRYTDLKSDLEEAGWQVHLTPFEIGSRGHVSKRNKTNISAIVKKLNFKINTDKLFKDLGKISLLCSFAIFQAHAQPSWQSPPLLKP